MSKDFKLFIKTFEKYVALFGLTDFRVYYKYEDLGCDLFADMYAHQQVATIRLNNALPDHAKPYKNVKESAKHEAIHLLLHRLESNAQWRYASEDEIKECVEALVRKLEKVIQ